MTPIFSVLQGAATAWIAALGLGLALLGLLRARLRLGEIYPAALAGGGPLFAAFCTVLAHSGLFRRGVLTAAAIVAALLGAALSRRLHIERTAPPPRLALAILIVPLLVFAWFPAQALLAPDLTPAGADAALASARHLCEGARDALWNASALWAAPFRFGAHSSAALLHLLFFASLAALVFAAIRRYSTTQAAVIAALLCSTAPASLLFASRAGTEILFWFCACAAVWLTALAVSSRQLQLLIPAFLSGGLAAQCIPVRADAFPGFIYPRLPWVLIPLAAVALGWLLRRQTAAACTLVGFHLLTSFPPLTPCLVKRPVLEAHQFGGDVQSFLTEHLSGYPQTRYLEEFVPPAGTILTDQILPESRLSRRLAHVALLRILGAAYDERALPARSRVLRVAPKPRRRYLPPPGGSIAEVRFYRGGVELPRSRDWRVRTTSGDSCAPLAFDNSLVTSCSGALEIDFGRDVVFDEVRITGTLGDLAPVPPGLRRAAVLELRRRGVTHLFLPAVSSAVADLSVNAPYWGVTEIGETHGAVLFQLD